MDAESGLGRAKLAPRAVILLLLILPTLIHHRSWDATLSPDALLLTSAGGMEGGLSDVWTADFFELEQDDVFEFSTGYYRPVTNTVFWVMKRVAADSIIPFNVTQMVLHGVNAVLVLMLLEAMGFGLVAAAATALLFAVHPVHAHAATDPATLADVLFPVFYLLALIGFERGLRGPPRATRFFSLVLVPLLYVLALLSKETAITLPAMLCVVVLYRYVRGEAPLSGLKWTLPAWGFLGLYLVVRFGVLAFPLQDFGFVARHGLFTVVVAETKAILIHVTRILMPLGPSYPELNPRLIDRLQPPLTDPLAYAGLATCAALAAGALLWKRVPQVALGCAFFVITFSPLFSVDHVAAALNPDVVPTEERWVYLSSIGILALVGLGFARLLGRPSASERRLVWGAALAVVVALTAAAYIHSGRYHDPFARLAQLYLVADEDLTNREQANRLILYAQWVSVPRGDLADAEARVSRAHALVPDSPVPAVALAWLASRRQNWSEVKRVLAPWYPPDEGSLARAAVTNDVVYHDVYSAMPNLSLLYGLAAGHLESPGAARPHLCEALRRGVSGSEAINAMLLQSGVNDGSATGRSASDACLEVPRPAGAEGQPSMP